MIGFAEDHLSSMRTYAQICGALESKQIGKDSKRTPSAIMFLFICVGANVLDPMHASSVVVGVV